MKKEIIEALIKDYEEQIEMDKDVLTFAMNSGESLAISTRIKTLEKIIMDLKKVLG